MTSCSGGRGAVKRTLRRALSLALMIMLFINSVPFSYLTSAEEKAGDPAVDEPAVICAENVDAAVPEGEHDLGDGGEPEADPAIDVGGEPEADPAADGGRESEADLVTDDAPDTAAPAPVRVTHRYALGDDAVSLSRMLSELGHDHSAIREVDLAGEDDCVRVESDGADYVVSARERFDEATLTVTTDAGIVCIILTDGRVAGEEPDQMPAEVPEPVGQPSADLPGTEAETPEVTEEEPEEVPEVMEEEPETPEVTEEEPETPEEPVGDEETEQIEEPAEEVKEDAAEDQPGDDAEPTQQQAETAVAYPAQSFRAGAGLMNVTAEAPEGAFPEGTTMEVRRVFNADTLSDIRETVAEDFVEVKKVYAVDISFLYHEEEIEPRLPVSVVMGVDRMAESQEAVVVHVDDEGTPVVVDPVQNDAAAVEIRHGEATPAEDAEAPEVPEVFDTPEVPDTPEVFVVPEAPEVSEVSEVSDTPETPETPEVPEAPYEEEYFTAEPVEAEHRVVEIEADSFSIYALVVTQTIEKLYIDAEGVSWKITVGYGPDAGISADAALEVREIDGEAHRAEMESLIPEGERLVQARFFDITIIDGGEAVQPDAPVNVCVSLADAPEAARPRAVHFGEAGGELLETTQGEDGVAFDAQSFSDYAIAYTVEFTDADYTWRMAGNTSIWLSRLLDALGSDIKINEVKTVVPPSSEKHTVAKEEGNWLLTLKSEALEQEETLTLTLNLKDGTERTINIKYRPAEMTNLREYLAEAEFLENGQLVGGSNDPNPMLARVDPHRYQLRLTFEEAGDALQFPENGVDYMRYDLPEGVKLDELDGYESTFSVLLDKKNTLYGNRVIFHKSTDGTSPGWIEIRWNDTPENKKKMKLMNFSPEATFTLNFEVSIPESFPPNTISFSDTVQVNLDLDTSFEIDLEKTAAMYTDDKEYEAKVDYPKLDYPKLDYPKLGGKDHIEETSKNTVTATDSNGNVLDEAENSMEADLNYLEMAKRAGEVRYEPVDERTDAEVDADRLNNDDLYRNYQWEKQYVKWTVTYNPEQLIDVEGATLQDHIRAGARDCVRYVNDNPEMPFEVKAYSQKPTVNTENGLFTPAEGDEGKLLDVDWNDVTVTPYA